MLSVFEETATFLKPHRLKLFLAMAAVLIGGFALAGHFEPTTAKLVRTVAMMLVWWLWLLFLVSVWFAQENKLDLEGAMFPRLAVAARSYLMAFVVAAFAFPVVFPMVFWLFR